MVKSILSLYLLKVMLPLTPSPIAKNVHHLHLILLHSPPPDPLQKSLVLFN